MLRHPRLSESYDWVVLGDSPAALLSAALVARMGLSVLVVTGGDEKKWILSSTGQVVDPEPNFIPGVGHPAHRLGLAGSCFSSLGLPESDWSSVLVESPVFQALTPRLRAGYDSDLAATRRSVLRESASSIPGPVLSLIDACAAGSGAIQDYWRGIPRRLTLPVAASSGESGERGSARPQEAAASGRHASSSRLLSEEGAHQEIVRDFSGDSASRAWAGLQEGLGSLGLSEAEREWVDAWLAGALGAEVPSHFSAFDVLRALVLAGDGVHIRGGLSAFRQALHRLAVRLGAVVADSSIRVSRLFIEEGRIMGVQLSGTETTRNVVQARGVLSSVHPGRVRSWVSSEGEGEAALFSGQDLIRVTLALTVPEEAIPPGLARRAIWRETGAPSLEIERTNPEDYGFARDSREFVFVRSCFHHDSTDWSLERWRSVCERMFRQAAEILPFLEERVERVFPDFRGEDFEAHWDGIYGRGLLASQEILRVPVARVPASERLRVEGLFEVHRALDPALGAHGEWSSALEATAWVAHRSGLAGPLG